MGLSRRGLVRTLDLNHHALGGRLLATDIFIEEAQEEMRKVLAVLAVVVIASTHAMASTPESRELPGDRWKGAGWYLVVETPQGKYIWSGPYINKPTCERLDRPVPHVDTFFECQYYQTLESSW